VVFVVVWCFGVVVLALLFVVVLALLFVVVCSSFHSYIISCTMLLSLLVVCLLFI